MHVLIIGAGISGLSLAARLAEDAGVTVLEAEDVPGYHASGRSAAMFEPDYGAPPIKALSHASADFYHDGGYLQRRGFLLVAAKGQADAFRQDLADLALDEIAPRDAVDLFGALAPDRVAQAGYQPDAWDIDTDRLLQDRARQLRAAGGRLLCRQRVTSIRRDRCWHVSTGTEAYEADLLINAAGPWADEVATLAGVAPVGLVPKRRSMARLAAPGGLDVTGWPMVLGAGESWYAKPDAGALLVSPAEADPHPPGDAWADDLVLAEGLARYEEMMRYPVTRPVASWAGLRSFVADTIPVLGRDPRCPSFVWCAGQGGYGFQIAPAAAEFLSDELLSRPINIDPSVRAAVLPNRFA